MGIETWLIKIKKSISRRTPPNEKLVIKKSKVGVLAFEIAGIMRELNHMWQNLSDKNVARLHNGSICLEGVRRIVSTDNVFLLRLACAEMVENLQILSKSVSRMSKRCKDSNLRCFETLFDRFANTGRDPHNWNLSWKEMEARNKKMKRYVIATATLYREIGELTDIENTLKKYLQYDDHSIEQHLQLTLQWRKPEIKYLKKKSLWNKTFDTLTSLLTRSIFTILSRIKLVFHIKHEENNHFFTTNSEILKPSSTTLGAAALALHYAKLIIVTEKMIKSPQFINVGVDPRDVIYSMLPNSIRSSLRCRLEGTGFTASDSVLAGEWRGALVKILAWLSPLAHNMMKWQSERSVVHQNLMPKTGVLLLQTLFFADQQKTEAAITELLVGLNYVWRFEREMNAKALLNCANFKNHVQKNTS